MAEQRLNINSNVILRFSMQTSDSSTSRHTLLKKKI